jgi:lysophospholipase L1-like esterase
MIATYGNSNGWAFQRYLVKRGHIVREKAVPGTQMKAICLSFIKDFFKVKADIYIIDGGGNDLQAGTQLKKTLRYFKILCFLLSLKRKPVFFLSIVPIDNDKGRHAIIWPDQVMFFNNHLHEICKKYKFIYVDVFNALKDMTFEMADENSEDGLHIGALEIIYNLWLEHAREGQIRWREDNDRP